MFLWVCICIGFLISNQKSLLHCLLNKNEFDVCFFSTIKALLFVYIVEFISFKFSHRLLLVSYISVVNVWNKLFGNAASASLQALLAQRLLSSILSLNFYLRRFFNVIQALYKCNYHHYCI